MQPPVVEAEIDEPGSGDLDRDGMGGGVRGEHLHQGVRQPRGLAPAPLAVTKAMLVDQSPFSRRAGRSRCTEAGSTARARPSRSATVVTAPLMARARWSWVDMLQRGYVVRAAGRQGSGTAPGDRTRVVPSTWEHRVPRPRNLPVTRPRSSADRASASGAVCAGSSPAGAPRAPTLGGSEEYSHLGCCRQDKWSSRGSGVVTG